MPLAVAPGLLSVLCEIGALDWLTGRRHTSSPGEIVVQGKADHLIEPANLPPSVAGRFDGRQLGIEDCESFGLGRLGGHVPICAARYRSSFAAALMPWQQDRRKTLRLYGVPDETTFLVPLRSNASTLLTGAPIAAMRRRLKFASLLYDRVVLEVGLLRLHAGAGGSFAVVEYGELGSARWQTPAQRGSDQASSFQLNVGRETTPGVPAAVTHPVLVSDNEVAWQATLEPFLAELPAETDWFMLTWTRDPDGDPAKMMKAWVSADEGNPALEAALPGHFVRAAVIKNANRDLAIAAADGLAVAVDPLHMQVVAQRFNDGLGWRLDGYSVPVLYPQVGDLPWQAIADLRREPNIARFRAVLREVEAETAADALTGGVETAANHAYERHLADASGRLDGVGTVVRRAFAGVVIGGVIGIAGSPIAGPLGIVATTGAGVGISTITNVRDIIRQRRTRGWVSVHHKIVGTGA
jgi:hypothetical protein